MADLLKPTRVLILVAVTLLAALGKEKIVAGRYLPANFFHKIFGGRPSYSTTLFGSKTAYRLVGNNRTNVSKPTDCQPVQLNMVIRHGTRNPSSIAIENFNDLSSTLNRLMKYNSTGQDWDLKIKFPWENPYKDKENLQLVDSGDQECYGIGRRFAQRFPQILRQRPLPIMKYKFVSSDTSRTTQSAMAFVMGYLLGKGRAGRFRLKAAPLVTIPEDKDTLLHYYDFCPKYAEEVRDNEAATYQEKKFLSGPYVARTVNKVRKRLGLDGVSEVTVKRVLAMHKACAYSIAVSGYTRYDGWCSVFDKEDFEVLNYAMDLDKYYRVGPAFEISYSISCVLLKDIFLSLQARAGRAVKYEKYNGHFRSAHSQTILPLYSLLGLLNNNKPLLADNYEKMRNRNFKSGKIVPFAGNIAFVLYQCENGNQKIQMYGNEKLIRLPFCKSKVDCSFSEFEKYYQNIVDQCDLKKMCKTT